MRVAVVGAGSWGTTLAVLLSDNCLDVSLWSYRESDAAIIRLRRENPSFLPGIPIPTAVQVTTSLEEAVRDAEIVVAAVPSQFLRAVMAQVREALPPRAVIVNVAKGIENGTLMTMSEMLADVLPECPADLIATLSGPSHAEEVSRKIPTTVVAASCSLETARLVQSVFMVP